MPTGKLRKWNYDRGFGFIIDEIEGNEIFVHGRQMDKAGINDPHVGDVLQYAIGVFNGRDEAVSIARISRVGE